MSKIQITKDDLGLSTAPDHFTGHSMATILGAVYMLAGIVAVVVIIIGAVRFIGAGGDSGQVASAKNTITYGVVGLVVILAAAAITQFVIENLIQ